MLVYESISTEWRPVSKGRIHVYGIPIILATLGIKRSHLTALGVVSKNDYNANIPSLGCDNFCIIKNLDDQDPVIARKNSDKETFAVTAIVCRSHTDAPPACYTDSPVTQFPRAPVSSVSTTSTSKPKGDCEIHGNKKEDARLEIGFGAINPGRHLTATDRLTALLCRVQIPAMRPQKNK